MDGRDAGKGREERTSLHRGSGELQEENRNFEGNRNNHGKLYGRGEDHLDDIQAAFFVGFISGASPAGFEPAASGLGILRSIQLSYGDTEGKMSLPAWVPASRESGIESYLENLGPVLSGDKESAGGGFPGYSV